MTNDEGTAQRSHSSLVHSSFVTRHSPCAVEDESDWAGVDQRHFHHGLELAALHFRHPPSGNVDEFLVKLLGFGGCGCVCIRRPATLATVAVQGELRDQQELSPDIQQTEIQFT